MLEQRFRNEGTLAEPKGIPDPQFALTSTVYWMRALALLVQTERLQWGSAQVFYRQQQRRSGSPQETNTIFEQLVFALHQLAALSSMAKIRPRADVARVGIITWYYGIYFGASAMIAAQNGTFQDSHAETAKCWDNQISARGLAMKPFDLRISTLVKGDADLEIAKLRGGSQSDLRSASTTANEALGACCAYLSGCAEWYRWTIQEALKESKEFRSLGVQDFRTKAAKALRDARFERRGMSFLHQASRYRGKANYREALFMGLGRGTETLLSPFLDDLVTVLLAFVQMAGAFSARRIGEPLWAEFLENVEQERAFSINPRCVWGEGFAAPGAGA